MDQYDPIRWGRELGEAFLVHSKNSIYELVAVDWTRDTIRPKFSLENREDEDVDDEGEDDSCGVRI